MERKKSKAEQERENLPIFEHKVEIVNMIKENLVFF